MHNCTGGATALGEIWGLFLFAVNMYNKDIMRDNTLFNLGKRNKELCEERGMSIKQLAEKSEVSQATIRNIINGTSQSPGIETLIKLCKAMEITLQELFTESEQVQTKQ